MTRVTEGLVQRADFCDTDLKLLFYENVIFTIFSLSDKSNQFIQLFLSGSVTVYSCFINPRKNFLYAFLVRACLEKLP